MKRHLVNTTYIEGFYFTACGILRAGIEPKAETTKRAKVSCGNCKKVMRARK